MEQQLKDLRELKYYEVNRNNPIIMKLEVSENLKLFHYTDKNGIEGILNSKNFWVTHSNYLDDVTEIKYMSFVLVGVIKYLIDQREDYDMGIDGQFYVYEAIIKTLKALCKIFESGAPISGGSLFLLSLSEDADNDYLKEHYCKHDGGILGFKNDIRNMFQIIGSNDLITFCAKVKYDLGLQMTLLLEDINEFYAELLTNLIHQEESVDYLELIEEIKSVIFNKIIHYSLFFKHHKYCGEKEYRVVFLVGEDDRKSVKIRMRYGKNVPYIEVKFNEESLIYTKYI